MVAKAKALARKLFLHPRGGLAVGVLDENVRAQDTIDVDITCVNRFAMSVIVMMR